MNDLLKENSQRGPWFRPRWFLGGFILMLALLALAGRWAGRVNYHRDFLRFFPAISPEASYYPTVAEMSTIVRARCRPDQVLIIVGGNSIHFGVGQPLGEVWTERLQDLLGDGFCVINFAFRGSSIADGGAVIGEVLRDEFPRQIYIANAAPVQPTDPLGTEAFRYLFWDAYFKGLLAPYPPREEAVRMYFLKDYFRLEENSFRLNSWADAGLRYRDFWNWAGWEKFALGSAPASPRLLEMIGPRKLRQDTELDARTTPFDLRFRAEIQGPEMAITRAFSGNAYEKTAEGKWQLKPAFRSTFEWNAKRLMPDTQKHRTLVVVSQNSPFYLAKLTADERVRNDIAYGETVQLWRELGYDAMIYPPGLVDDDFVDRTHLTITGGAKLAGAVATEVRSLAQSLNYLPMPHP